MRIGNREFETEHNTYVMGILNVTPDSFSDGGSYDNLDSALRHAEQMIAEGADIIDVGGESTRPGHTQIPDEEEIERTMPVIAKIKANFDIPVSLDTYKSKVAEAGIDAGADMINDIWGLKYDPEMAQVISDNKIACCLMHNRTDQNYQDFMADVIRDLRESLELAEAAGIEKNQIMLDPGVGFAKSLAQNLMVIQDLDQIAELGYPVLLGTSRKSTIGRVLDLPADEREEGTLVTTVIGMERGAAFVRVHDVKKNVRAVKMAEAILHVNHQGE